GGAGGGLADAVDGGDLAVDETEPQVEEAHQFLAPRHEFSGVSLALAAAADEREVDSVARRVVANAAEHVTRDDHRAERSAGRARDKLSSCDFVSFHL